MSQASATPSQAAAGANHRWWILAVLGLAQLVVVLDATIVNIALPDAQADLGFGDASRQWIVTGYSLAFGSLLLLGGRLTGMLGRRNTLMIGAVGFALASAVGGAAPSFEVLVGARVAQGVFGALLAPSTLSLMTVTFAGSKGRDKAFAVFGAIAGGGGGVGLLLGGLLTEYVSWRWCMYVNLFMVAVVVLGAFVFIPQQPREDQGHGLDLRGAVLSFVGVFALVLGFAQSETDGWASITSWLPLAVGVLALVAFGLAEHRSTHPLLPLRVLADRSRGASYLTVLIAAISMFGVFLFLTYYLQETLGFSPIRSGVAFLPMVGSILVTAPVVGAVLRPRVGPRPLVPLGALIAASGMLWLTQIGVHTAYLTHVLPGLVLFGVGMGFVFSNAMNSATNNVRREDAGVASAVVNTSQQVGGSIGTSLLSSIAASAATAYAVDHASDADVAMAAAVHSYATAFAWSAAFFLVAGVLAAILYPSGAPSGDADSHAAPGEAAGEAAGPRHLSAHPAGVHKDGVPTHAGAGAPSGSSAGSSAGSSSGSAGHRG
ncbi:MFS transporter [Nocardioides sp. GY 10127]|uniref:MFS transporter n=1 Tax=Nocardioides sp. GY 10127 TaxID=2569762 RepID=UPI0010A88C63|nr:MFS transporter [Nocardioides sp. GY 10127]TIC80140.1 MFS transporter [Nocardioides sp. GY 10127]